jgi:tetratricopeptide (TPR) repeat protein
MRLLEITITFLFLFSVPVIRAQKIDSALVIRLTDQADSLTEARDLKMAFRLSDSALKIARELKNLRWEGYAIAYKGSLYNYLDDVGNALNCYDASISLYGKIGYRQGLISGWLNKGNVYFGINEGSGIKVVGRDIF